MKNLLVAAVGLLTVGFVGIGHAADMPAKARPMVAPAFSWTGFYVGGNAGYAWGRSNFASTDVCPSPGLCPVNFAGNLALISSLGTGSMSPKGFTGGVQAGYNWQNASWVYGIEADFNAFDLNDSRTASATSLTSVSIFNSTTTLSTDWLFTLRGRVGFTVVPTVLLYATGGWAVTQATLSNTQTVTVASLAAGSSSTRSTLNGWTVGGGAEWALDRKWSVKAEYLYADFGSLSTTAAVSGAGFAVANIYSTSADLRTHTARGGVNYRF